MTRYVAFPAQDADIEVVKEELELLGATDVEPREDGCSVIFEADASIVSAAEASEAIQTIKELGDEEGEEAA